MYCTNIRIKKKENVVCVTPRLARNHSRHPIPKALRITRSSFGVATVTTAPFSTWYECAPTFMVVGASNGAVAAVVDVFAVNSVLRFRGEALPTPRLRAARNALAARDCSPRQVSNIENTNTGNATRASRIKRFRRARRRWCFKRAELPASASAVSSASCFVWWSVFASSSFPPARDTALLFESIRWPRNCLSIKSSSDDVSDESSGKTIDSASRPWKEPPSFLPEPLAPRVFAARFSVSSNRVSPFPDTASSKEEVFATVSSSKASKSSSSSWCSFAVAKACRSALARITAACSFALIFLSLLAAMSRKLV
mmetsp:Transcript_9125/g.34112  ORF Transcript_9125/g.34112 Transcript_9125/m.34112 type:complete len:312 (-) Transcript_9125:503-1438(-)